MMNIVTRYVVTLLGTACVIEGYWVYLQNSLLGAPERPLQEQRARWSADIEELKKLRAQPAPAFPEEGGASASRTLEEWFQARTGAAGIRSEIASTDREVIVSFRVPGLQGDSLNVAVEGVRVTITCVADIVEDAGGGYRREALRHYELVMPLPANADASRHRVVREGESFKIIFARFDDPLLKS